MPLSSVGRACFFAGFAVWATMFGLITEPMLALRVGEALAEIYSRYARYALAIAGLFWLLAIACDLFWPDWDPRLL